MQDKDSVVTATASRVARQMMASRWIKRLIGDLDRAMVFEYLVKELGIRMERLEEDAASVRAAAMACAIKRARQVTMEEGTTIGFASRPVR